MELMFNELSILPLAQDKYEANNRMVFFAKTASRAVQKDFNKIRMNFDAGVIKLTKDYSFQDWIFDKEFQKINHTYRGFLLGMIVKPFISEDDNEIEERFINSHYYFENSINGTERQECLGLASAYLYETLSISFQSGDTWLKNDLKIIIDCRGKIHSGDVKNVFSKNCFDNRSISNFIEQLENIQLIETEILPEEKRLQLFGDHHGKEILHGFWNKLKKCRYVIESRSTDFLRGSPKFIGKIEPEGHKGVIILVPYHPYTLWVQTTGRNYRETKEIAQILQREYS